MADRDEAQRLRAAQARRGEHAYWASWAYVSLMQDRERHALRLLHRYQVFPIAPRFILDVGCGTGSWIHDFVRWGARPEHITGVDLLADDLATARRRVPEGVRLEVGDATSLRFASASFDLVLQSTVFTSVLDRERRRAMAAEMLRVLRPDGLIVWYDFFRNNPRNPDVRRVTAREIHDLFPDCAIDLRRISLAPPVARLVAPRSWLLTYLLGRVPFLCSHYLGAIMMRGSRGVGRLRPAAVGRQRESAAATSGARA